MLCDLFSPQVSTAVLVPASDGEGIGMRIVLLACYLADIAPLGRETTS